MLNKFIALGIAAVASGSLWAARFSDDDDVSAVLGGGTSLFWRMTGKYVLYALLAIALFVIYRLMKGLGRTKVTGKTIALTSVQINLDVQTGEYATFNGRIVGIMAWILSRLGLDATYRLRAAAKGVSLKESNIVGQNETFLPGSQISEIYCAYSRDANWLLYGVILVALSFYSCISLSLGYPVVLFFLLVAALCGYLFYASKKLLLYVATPSSYVWIRFSEGFFENVHMDFAKLRELVHALGEKYHDIQTGKVTISKPPKL
jgi:hypothetical protein